MTAQLLTIDKSIEVIPTLYSRIPDPGAPIEAPVATGVYAVIGANNGPHNYNWDPWTSNTTVGTLLLGNHEVFSYDPVHNRLWMVYFNDTLNRHVLQFATIDSTGAIDGQLSTVIAPWPQNLGGWTSGDTSFPSNIRDFGVYNNYMIVADKTNELKAWKYNETTDILDPIDIVDDDFTATDMIRTASGRIPRLPTPNPFDTDVDEVENVNIDLNGQYMVFSNRTLSVNTMRLATGITYRDDAIVLSGTLKTLSNFHGTPCLHLSDGAGVPSIDGIWRMGTNPIQLFSIPVTFDAGVADPATFDRWEVIQAPSETANNYFTFAIVHYIEEISEAETDVEEDALAPILPLVLTPLSISIVPRRVTSEAPSDGADATKVYIEPAVRRYEMRIHKPQAELILDREGWYFDYKEVRYYFRELEIDPDAKDRQTYLGYFDFETHAYLEARGTPVSDSDSEGA